jgi:hypothetical protein
MTIRHAACACRRLQMTLEGEPRLVSMCHCLECQRRTGSAFGVQAWFAPEQIAEISGEASQYVRATDSGRTVAFQFCPHCGSTISWRAELRPDLVAVAVGAFADPKFVSPNVALWERRRHEWLAALADLPCQHSS